MEDPLGLLKEGEALAYRLYAREIRRRIGTFYLLVASYVPLVLFVESEFERSSIGDKGVAEVLIGGSFTYCS